MSVTENIELLILNNPNTRAKLQLLGYDDEEYVAEKLKEMERTLSNDID